MRTFDGVDNAESSVATRTRAEVDAGFMRVACEKHYSRARANSDNLVVKCKTIMERLARKAEMSEGNGRSKLDQEMAGRCGFSRSVF